jgi:hypothetical protein
MRSWVGHVARMGEKKNSYRDSVGNPGGKRLVERPDVDWRILFTKYIQVVRNAHKYIYKKICSVWLINYKKKNYSRLVILLIRAFAVQLFVCFVFPGPLNCT